MQLLEAFGVRGGVGLPGTGLCWKLEMADPPPPPPPPGPPAPARGDMLGSSVLMRAGKMPGLEAAPAIPAMDWLGPPGRMAGLMEPSPPCWELRGKFWWLVAMELMFCMVLAGIMLLCLMAEGIPAKPGPGPLAML